MEVLHKYIMNRLVDKTTGDIIRVGGGGALSLDSLDGGNMRIMQCKMNHKR